MDLEQLEENKKYVIVMDREEYIQEVEDIEELVNEGEVAFSNVDGILAMGESYREILTNADKENITANQVLALRASVVASMQAAKGDAKSLLGLDMESTVIVPSSSLQYDLEGVKDFVKKLWEKFKSALVKANAFFKKLFLKILNVVSMRKGTIERLEEEVSNATSIRSEITNAGLAKKLTLVNFYNEKNSDVVSVGSYTKIKNYITIKGSGKGLETSVKTLEKRVKLLDSMVKKKDFAELIDAKYFNDIDDGILSIANLKKLSSGSLLTDKIDKFILGGVEGVNAYGIGISPKGKVMKFTVALKYQKGKAITDIKQNSLTALLKDAGNINDDFKSLVDDTFALVGDTMDASDRLGDIIMSKDAVTLFDENKKQFAREKKDMKNIISLTPWLAYKQVMGVYREIGAVISLATEALKDK